MWWYFRGPPGAKVAAAKPIFGSALRKFVRQLGRLVGPETKDSLTAGREEER